MSTTWRSSIRTLILLGIVYVIALIVVDGLAQALLLELPLGWIGFLRRTIPQISANWTTLGTSLILLLLLVGGFHQSVRWLLKNWRAEQLPQANLSWRLRASVSVLSMLTLLIIAGMAGTGIVHQAAWLGSLKEPLRIPSPRFSVMSSANTARVLAGALDQAMLEHQTNAPAIRKSLRDYMKDGVSPGFSVLLFTDPNQKVTNWAVIYNQPKFSAILWMTNDVLTLKPEREIAAEIRAAAGEVVLCQPW